ncbi:hypothetical protein FOPG_19914 [Fusarium oxysporum f. sp. conglutinans race 2 54008]|uniref:NmrA-like domain-containing protein n=3 Tax=Fusarium oxysporum f. sp. conglutinans TaxID=100902 RepID=A0A8H6LMD2_FUSOX|nr:hypothetical protein FOXB_00929 [Fusarium oxysporum f. sp. conglutinans Fo5176]EXL63813.1 hypothetical protein FOPG_19914 [Fusarium oxysporum f. sp. conglutinans race 2 54008]KAF6525439.1 hypothetical protein HZS61_011234 [Fusarium oxysporum f. sp. conglutinans]KAG6997287.1 hypothetical protein FocnCong_v015410 [Fusarium oxysporum f. sp. conglutinans]KAI8411386.1 hypothetical protein FOFC_07980 [Fusarium oxysporum]
MPTLAIAGGTSASLGRAITTAVFANQRLAQWDVVILSRSRRVPHWLCAIDEKAERHKIRVVDYLSSESLASALKGVHTVVSVTSAHDGTQAQVQINLLHAAIEANCKRFAPSQWGFGSKGWEAIETLRWANHGVQEECIKQRGKIEFTNFNHGSFMNYIGHGIFPLPGPELDEVTALDELRKGFGYKPGEDEACAGLHRQGPLTDKSGAHLIGMRNGIAELPIKDDGTWPRITFTTLPDVGRFVAASLDLPKWEEDMSMAGDTLTMGELLRHAEAVTGRKFNVTILKREDLERKREKTPQDDFMGRLWTDFDLAYIQDREDEGVLRPVVNGLCPEVKPISVREYMETYWIEA